MYKYLIPGKTDLATLNPTLAAKWHPILNGDLKPSEVTEYSHKKVWWQCKKGHEWQATVQNRSNGRGCPYCAGQKVIPGETDLLTINPALAAEWHPLKNGELKPSEITSKSNKKVWWQCKEGHEWQAIINNRSNGRGCPYCAGQKVIPGETDLLTINPALAAEWHPFKNGIRSPEKTTAFCNDKVWWRCKRGHEWQATVFSRSNGCGCPYCSGLRAIPGETDLLTLNPELAAEWHLERNGNIKPRDFTLYSHQKVWWRCKNGHEWQATISSRSKGCGCPYCARQRAIPGETDLLKQNPVLAAEWHPERNGDLMPADVTVNSQKKVWWCCKKGHEWQAIINNRSKGRGCPYCAGLLAIPGETDLLTLNPVLAEEWHPERNGDLMPSDVTAHSGEKVWWRCKKGHEWQATISSRSKGCGCPYCARRRAIPGETDLLTLNPVLAAEWHPERNGNMKPSDFTMYSHKKVWWLCKKGHEWQTTISVRSEGCGCPYCAGQRAIPGETDLLTLNPTLAAEWHTERNGDLMSTDVTVNSAKKVWWRCKNGHEWQAKIFSRSEGSNCPYCYKESR